MSNFWQRTITGFFLTLIVVVCTLLGEWSYFILLLTINGLCLYEFYELTLPDKSWQERYSGLIAGMIINIMFIFIIRGDLSLSWAYHLIPVFLFLLLLKLFENTGRETDNMAYQILGVVYLCFPMVMMADLGYLNSLTYSFQIPLGFFILHWVSDTGAYLSGRQFGKHKLFERISPKKTMEGFIGAIALCLVAGAVLSLFWDDLTRTEWLIMSTLIAIFGSAGDLVESLIKRNLNIKDSGNLLPGHGGFLDRFDGFFISAPAVYFYLQLTT